MRQLITRCVRARVLFFLVAILLITNPVGAQAPDEYMPDYLSGYNTGYSNGFEIGFDAGFDRGTQEGTDDGDEEGFAAGWDFAYYPAYDAAYDAALPEGKLAGFEEALPQGAEDGYAWAKTVHEYVSNNGVTYSIGNVLIRDIDGFLDISLIDWGNGNLSWSGVNFLTISSGIAAWLTPDWHQHYYDEGYSDGYSEGNSIGDEQGYNEAYPLAFEAAYDAAYPRGVDEGTFQGEADGTEAGYDDGFGIGYGSGEDVGFDIGVALYRSGGQVSDLDPTAYVAAYGNQLGRVARGTAPALPEPTSAGLFSFGLLMIACRRGDRKGR